MILPFTLGVTLGVTTSSIIEYFNFCLTICCFIVLFTISGSKAIAFSTGSSKYFPYFFNFLACFAALVNGLTILAAPSVAAIATSTGLSFTNSIIFFGPPNLPPSAASVASAVISVPKYPGTA